MDIRKEDHLKGGEFIAPNASDAAEEFILMARTIMYDEQSDEAVRTALIGTAKLIDSVAPFIAMTIQGLESKLDELSQIDRQVVAIHLAGSMVDLAKEQGDPEAVKGAAEEIADRVLQMLEKNPDGQAGMQGPPMAEPMPPNGPPPPAEPPPGAGPLLGAIGAGNG